MSACHTYNYYSFTKHIVLKKTGDQYITFLHTNIPEFISNTLSFADSAFVNKIGLKTYHKIVFQTLQMN